MQYNTCSVAFFESALSKLNELSLPAAVSFRVMLHFELPQ
jgi:hypothetical protein